jgi:hypothetical protein
MAYDSVPALALPTLLCAALPLVVACAAQPEPSVPAASPPPRAAPAQVSPGPTASEIRSAVRSRNDELTQCYLAGTFKDAELAGTVNVSFTIEPTGKVKEAVDAGSDLPDAEVVRCVLEVFAGLEFTPGGASATEVTYPIRFGSRG